MKMNLRQRLAAIKLLVLDCDGVLTDGGLGYTDAGGEFKIFNSVDSHGLKMAMRAGVVVAIVSGRSASCLEQRATNLGITTLHMSIKEKLPVIEEVIKKHGLDWSQTAVFGDDIVDLQAMLQAGVSVAPPGADRQVLRRADYVTTAGAGHGAVREFVEKMLKASGSWKEVSGKYFVSQGARS